MGDKDFTKRLQAVEKRQEDIISDLRDFYGLLGEIAGKQNALVDRLEESGALKQKKIVTLN